MGDVWSDQIWPFIVELSAHHQPQYRAGTKHGGGGGGVGGSRQRAASDVLHSSSYREPPRHVQVRPRSAVLNMLRRLDRIRFRGHKREDLLDLAESPNASDTECGDEIPLKTPRPSPRDSEELRDPVSMPGPESFTSLDMGSGGRRRGIVPSSWVAKLNLDMGRFMPDQAI